MINVDAERKEDLPAKETVRGTFWFFKSKEGWHGEFTLDNYGQQKYPYVITLGVYRPTRQLTHQINSREEAEAMLSYLGMVSGYILQCNIAISEFCIPITDMNMELLNAILSYTPRNMFGQSLEKDYLKYVSEILGEMQKIAPELYQELTEKYPEYKSEKYIPNYVGRFAYTRTLRDGCTIYDGRGNVGVLKDGKIYCDNFKGIVPFGGESASVVIELGETSTIEITDNSQVCEGTIFK